MLRTLWNDLRLTTLACFHVFKLEDLFMCVARQLTLLYGLGTEGIAPQKNAGP